MYAIIDVETTGTNSRKEKITEIAIFIHDGSKITDRYVTLVNPEKKIPYRITQITGITNKMVSDAPKFYEIAAHIVKMTEGCIFVAHNVNFDYNFIRSEFASLGYDFSLKKMCTVRLSRKLIPGKRSYSLGRLCQELGISLKNRHRAAGDAEATVKVLELLLKIDPALSAIPVKQLNTHLSRETIAALPEEPGVYYFYNENREVIYVGKSLNIRERVVSHLTSGSTRKAINLKEHIHDVSYELTGSELAALLKESHEIKTLKPRFNRAQRRTTFRFALYSHYDGQGYLCLVIKRIEGCEPPLTTFTSQASGRSTLFALAEEYGLCQKLCGLYKTNSACFHYSIRQCRGACIGEESPEDYNRRVLQAIGRYRFQQDNFIIIDKGRQEEEKTVVAVLNGAYYGFGYLSREMLESTYDHETLIEYIPRYDDNRDVQQIIRSYLNSHQVEKVVRVG